MRSTVRSWRPRRTARLRGWWTCTVGGERPSGWERLCFLAHLNYSRPPVFLQMTTATRAPSLTHPRWNRKTVAAPAPPQTPPPRPTAKEAKSRPTRAPTVREVSRTWTLYLKWCPRSQPAGGIAAAAAPIRWMPRHFLFLSPQQPVPASASTKQPNVRENWGTEERNVHMSSGKGTPSSETSERAQSAKRDGLSSGEKNSSESKPTQVQTRVLWTPSRGHGGMGLIGSHFSL